MMKNNDVSSVSSSVSTNSSSTKRSSTSGQKTLKEIIAERRRKSLNESKENIIDMLDPYEAVNNYKNFQLKKTGFIEQESSGHYCLWDSNYPENPERVACARRRLEALDLIKRCERIEPEVFSEDLFLKKHTNELLHKLKSTSHLTTVQLHEESAKWDAIYITQETYKYAKLTAEAALTLTLKVAKGDLKNGFALIRPPGHHAMKNAFCGYCFLNSVAVAAETAIQQGLAKKVLIVDYDIHHGQGTQQMFYNRNDVLYFSIHRFEHGEFWPNLRESDSDYIGEGIGKGYNVNVPLNKTGMGDNEYLAIVLNLLLPLAYEFMPDLILISAGYDAAVGCPEGEMNVTPHFYGHLVSLLSGLADGKIAVCLEGGYFKESLAEGVACTLKALLGDVCYPLNIHSNPTVNPVVQDVINNVKYFLHDFWECFNSEPLFAYPKEGQIEESLNINEDDHVTCIDFKYAGDPVTIFETVDCYPVQDDKVKEYFLNTVEQLRKEYAQSRICNNVVGYVYDEELLKHKPTGDTGKTPPERPERLSEIMQHFEEFGLKERTKKIDVSRFDVNYWLEKIHNSDYIKNITDQRNLTEKPDWFYNEHTTACIEKCVSCILSLAQNISENDIRCGAAFIRPPGHHAMSCSGSGFCFVNNVVIAAEYLIETKNYKRILIVDFDIHHGNGTQDLTYKRNDIMYISVHRFDNGKFFPSHPNADFNFTGEGVGNGYNVNIPFNKGNKTNTDYWAIWHRFILPLAYSYNPEFIIVSAGFDAGIYDPLGGGYKLTPEIYGHFVNTLKPLASGRILLALEGGYHLKTTAFSMTMCVKALCGDPLPMLTLSEKISDDTLKTIKQVVSTHKLKWPILQINRNIANFFSTKEQKGNLEELIDKNIEGYSTAKQEFDEIVDQCKENAKYFNK